MEIHIWCILASILLATAYAGRYDTGPQRFYQSSSPARAPRQDQQVETKEVILYLTPSQVKALEASGALVKSQPAVEPEAEEEQREDAEQAAEEEETQSESNESSESSESSEAADNSEETESNESAESAENSENAKDSDNAEEEQSEEELGLEEILKILNEQQDAENNKNAPVSEEPQEDEQVTEKPRNFLSRYQILQKSRSEGKYFAPSVLRKQPTRFAYIRYNPEVPETLNIVRAEQEQVRPVEEAQPEPEEVPAVQEQDQPKRYKLIPVEATEEAQEPEQPKEEKVEEKPQEPSDERLALLPLLQNKKIADKVAERLAQQKQKLLKNEISLQNTLRELQGSPKHNNQKYAIEVERLRANLERQNALAKAEVLAKAAPAIIKEELLKKRRLPSGNKQGKTLGSASAQLRVPEVPVPTVKIEQPEADKPAVKKRAPKNVYVKVNKPFFSERAVPEVKRETRRPERVTVLRHVWEH